ncbi:hypothetical protein EGI20_08735, partial [Aquitalea sp. S1-19]|nr:hypothetical protein [Aquitalea sp. S1-19]
SRRDANFRIKIGQTKTLSDVYTLYVKDKHALTLATRQTYDKNYRALARYHERDMSLVSAVEWKDLLLEIKHKSGETTAHQTMIFLSTLYKYARNMEYVSTSPISKISATNLFKKPSPRRKKLSIENLPGFIAHAQTLHPLLRDFLMIALLQGWRKSIIANMRWDRVDFANRTYHIQPEDVGNKNHGTYDMPICDWVWGNIIEPRSKTRAPDAVWILPSHKHQGKPTSSPEDALKKISESIGGVEVCCHILRKTFATFADFKLKDMRLLQYLMMHSVAIEYKVTDSYIVSDRADNLYKRTQLNIVAEFMLNLDN